MITFHEIIRRPLVTEKVVDKKEKERTMAFEVSSQANKIQIAKAVEKLFNVRVEEVRTANFEGKLRRRGRFAGYRSDWKKAYVKIEAGQKMPEFADL